MSPTPRARRGPDTTGKTRVTRALRLGFYTWDDGDVVLMVDPHQLLITVRWLDGSVSHYSTDDPLCAYALTREQLYRDGPSE